MTKSQVFLYLCLSFILGIFLNSFLKISLPALLAILILGLILISVLWKYKSLVVIGFCLLFLVLGIWHHQMAQLQIATSPLKLFNHGEKVFSLVGVVSAEPDIKETNIKLIIKPAKIWDKETVLSLKTLKGKILVTARRYPQYQYGDKLKIRGKLKTPHKFGDFDYPGYLAKDGIYSVMYFPKIELLERGNYGDLTSTIYVKILSFKNKLREVIYQNLSPSHSSILAAMILGDKRKISDDLKQRLNITGVRHITAISGLHITIISSILMTILIGLGLWRTHSFWLSIILITLFIIMTGLQSSAIRAGIMGGLFLISQYVGRMAVSSRSIVFAAALMLGQNPLLLKLDVGFQLSFLAMMGIIYLLPIFQHWFKKIPQISQLRSILAMTISAQIFTLPILIYNFGYISFVAPITNILIVFLLPWIMLFGFLFAFSGAIWQPFGWLLSLPMWMLLTYVIKIVDLSSKLPLASKTLEMSWMWLAISYLILGLITWRLQERQRLKFLNY